MSGSKDRVWTRALGWVSRAEADAMELKGYAKEMPPSVAEIALVKAGTHKINRAPSTGKSLPPKPEQSGLHPLQMGDRNVIRAEFHALITWVKQADAAPGAFAPRQEIERDMIAERVDLLRWYAFS